MAAWLKMTTPFLPTTSFSWLQRGWRGKNKSDYIIFSVGYEWGKIKLLLKVLLSTKSWSPKSPPLSKCCPRCWGKMFWETHGFCGSTKSQRQSLILIREAEGARLQIYLTRKPWSKSKLAALCASKNQFGHRVIKEQNLAQYIKQLLIIVLPQE